MLHVGHEGERWPIDIEDHEGNLHSISLEPGQVRIALQCCCFVSGSTTSGASQTVEVTERQQECMLRTQARGLHVSCACGLDQSWY